MVLFAVTGAVVLSTAGSASAHAQLVSSTPGEGAVVETAPTAITLEFNERIEARADGTRIFTGGGTEIPATVKSADRTARITPAQGLPDGTVVLSWAVVSADGHAINGSITFAVGAPTPGNVANDAFEEPVTTGIGPVRWVLTGIAVFSVVALVVGIGLNRPRLVEASFRLGVSATVLVVLFAALDRNARGWDGLRDWGEWVDGWLSWQGLIVALGVLVAASAVASMRSTRRLPALLAGVLLVVLVPTAWATAGPTPSPSIAQPAGDPVAEVDVAGHTVRVEFASVSVGTTEVTLSLLEDGDPVAAYAVPRLALRTDGLALGDVPLEETEAEGEGVYRGRVTVPQPGEWTVEVSVRIDEFANPVVELPFRFGSRAPATSGGH
nr:copper resistance protein CopC [Nocardioides daedukensis]